MSTISVAQEVIRWPSLDRRRANLGEQDRVASTHVKRAIGWRLRRSDNLLLARRLTWRFPSEQYPVSGMALDIKSRSKERGCPIACNVISNIALEFAEGRPRLTCRPLRTTRGLSACFSTLRISTAEISLASIHPSRTVVATLVRQSTPARWQISDMPQGRLSDIFRLHSAATACSRRPSFRANSFCDRPRSILATIRAAPGSAPAIFLRPRKSPDFPRLKASRTAASSRRSVASACGRR